MTEHEQGYDVHALSGAYAVDALDGEERTRFEAHLSQCADCREEVDGLRETAALLGTDTVVPPPALREAVLSGISAIRPLPPLVTETAGSTADLPAPVDLSARRRRRLLNRMPLLVAAAVVLLLAVGTAFVRPWADDSTPGKQQQLTAAEQVLAADDRVVVEKKFPDGAQATIVHSRSVGRTLIETVDMPPAPDGKVYELWFQTPAGEMVRAGLMPPVRDQVYVLEGDGSRAVGVGITVEPAGGSNKPSSEPIAYFPLDA
jgi:anti-sigma-K factor RskA